MGSGVSVSKSKFDGHGCTVIGISCFTLANGAPRVISHSNDGEVRVWDPLTGKCVQVLERGWDSREAKNAHLRASRVQSFTLSDAELSERHVGRTNVNNLQEKRRYDIPLGEDVACFTLDDGATCAIRNSRVWDPVTGTDLATLKGQGGPVACFTLADGVTPRAISASKSELCLWDPLAGTCLATYKDYATDALACFSLVDGTPRAIYVNRSTGSSTLGVMDPLAGTHVATLEGHTGQVVAVACFTLADGAPRAVEAREVSRQLHVWDPIAGTCLTTIKGLPTQPHAIACFTLADGAPRVIVGGNRTLFGYKRDDFYAKLGDFRLSVYAPVKWTARDKKVYATRMALDREAPGKTARALKLSIREWLAIEKPLAAVGLRRDDVLDILGDPDALDPDGGKRCSFWFVRAEKLRTFTGTTPPKLQELRRKHPDWLEQQTISFVDGSKGVYKHKILVVSHRWEHPDEPDKAGVQFKEVKAHLDAHGAIEFVWFDFWSMPQGKKTGSESAEFKVMLPNINLLYLFCGVLILADLSYVSRFWTQFEAFLSLRTVTANGLESTLEDERRCVIKGIHNAFDNIDKNIIDMWANKTAEEAHEILSKPDVTVTNQSDKDAQLPKLLKLNDFAKKMGAAA